VDRSKGEWKSTDIRKEGGKGQFQYFVLPAFNLVVMTSVLSVQMRLVLTYCGRWELSSSGCDAVSLGGKMPTFQEWPQGSDCPHFDLSS